MSQGVGEFFNLIQSIQSQSQLIDLIVGWANLKPVSVDDNEWQRVKVTKVTSEWRVTKEFEACDGFWFRNAIAAGFVLLDQLLD